MDAPDWEERYKLERKPPPPSQLVVDVADSLPPAEPSISLAERAATPCGSPARDGRSLRSTLLLPPSPGCADLAGDLPLDAQVADLEKHEFTIQPAAWDLIVISLYLQRDLFEPAKRGLRQGGVLIATTLLEEEGEPKPYRVKVGELVGYFQGWEVLHSFEGQRNEHAIAEIAVVARLERAASTLVFGMRPSAPIAMKIDAVVARQGLLDTGAVESVLVFGLGTRGSTDDCARLLLLVGGAKESTRE